MLLITFKFAWWFEWYVPQDGLWMESTGFVALKIPKFETMIIHYDVWNAGFCKHSLQRDWSTFSSRQRAFAGITRGFLWGFIIIRNKCGKCFFLLLLCTLLRRLLQASNPILLPVKITLSYSFQWLPVSNPFSSLKLSGLGAGHFSMIS